MLLPNPLIDLLDYKRLLAGDRALLARLGAHDYFYQRRAHHSDPLVPNSGASIRGIIGLPDSSMAAQMRRFGVFAMAAT